MQYTEHPAAALFPLESDDKLQELAASIKTNGLLEPISVTPNGVLLDGRNRIKACAIAGVEPMVAVVDPRDPIAFICARNVHRRHLSTAERSEIAAKLATLDRGRPTEKGPNGPFIAPTIEQAAELLNVSPRSVKRAKAKQKKTEPKPIGWVMAAELIIGKGKLPPGFRRNTMVQKKAQIEAAIGEEIPSHIDKGGRLARVIADHIVREAGRKRSQEELAAAAAEAEAAVPEGARAQFKAAVKKAVDAEIARLRRIFESQVEEHVEKRLVQRREKLAAAEREIAEWRDALNDRQRDISTYMSEDEYRLVLGCLHPDRPDRTADRLGKAFEIFQRLERYVAVYSPKALAERGWNPKRKG